uniref:Uncharacterized protein n=1 Tax=Oncorhynchus mykiss TaxID=8022 RepID=A0A8K9Y1M1_ONCMY
MPPFPFPTGLPDQTARAMIFENQSLCDEVAHLEKFVRVKEEHRFLLKSLLQYQSVSEGEMLIAASTTQRGRLAPKPGLGKKTKKERKEGGRENGEEDMGLVSWFSSSLWTPQDVLSSP